MHATSLSQLWHEAITAEPLPPRLLVLGTAAAALILVGWRRAWPLSRIVVTIAHEGGHALVALAVGRRLDGVRVHRSTAGLTVSAGNASGPGIVATAAAGYLAPPFLGLGAAALLATGHLVAALLLTLVLLAALTLMVRNAYGILATVTVAAAVALVTWRGSSCYRRRSATRWPGSCCSGGSGPSWSCSAPAGGAGRPARTRTSSRRSLVLRAVSGSRCSSWWPWVPWSSAGSG